MQNFASLRQDFAGVDAFPPVEARPRVDARGFFQCAVLAAAATISRRAGRLVAVARRRQTGGGAYGGSFGRGGGGRKQYVRREGDNADVDVAAVEALIAERTQLRRQRDFSAADLVRDRLTVEYGVTVYDRDSEWFVGGGFSRGGTGRGAADGWSDARSRQQKEGRPQLIQRLRGTRKSSEVTQLLEKIPPRTDREFTTGISAYGRAGDWERALSLFDEMRESGVTPDVFSFSAAISACGKGRQ